MVNSAETVRGNYRGHTYQVALTYVHVTGSGDKFMTSSEVIVDGNLITLSTPGYVDTHTRTKSGVLQEVKAYVDYLEDKQVHI